MELYIYNSNRELEGIVESFEYLRWTRQYSQCGSFEIKAIATQENADLLKEGNIIWKNDDEEAGIIEHLELSQTEQEFITASGRFATSLLARRIVWQTEILSGDLSACVEQLINNNLINPSDTARKMGTLRFEDHCYILFISKPECAHQYTGIIPELDGCGDRPMRGFRCWYQDRVYSCVRGFYGSVVYGY